jgi:DNA-binding beta-propeller fold protein YncE
VIDGTAGTVLSSIGTNVGVADPSSGEESFGLVAAPSAAPTFRSVALDSVVISHDGTRAYLVHRRDRQGVIRTTQPAGYYTAIISTTPVVTPAVTTIDIASGQALDDNTSEVFNFPSPVIFPSTTESSSDDCGGCAEGTPFIGVAGGGGGSSGSAYGSTPFGSAPWTQGPVASIEDPQGQFLYVANESSDDVTVLQTQSRVSSNSGNGVVGLVQVGSAPSGLALSFDAKTLYVHNSLDYSVSVVQSVNGTLTEIDRITVSSPGSMNPDAVEGRRLFFSAADPVMTIPGGGVACESCHTEAGSDGNVWQFTHGPRKTPSLLGRQIKDTAPYHWDGTEVDFPSFFDETVVVRMGGLGVSAQQSNQIQTYMQGLQTPDNPFRQTGGGLTAAQSRGQALFAGQAACITCHNGPDFTDNGFHDVGTFVSVNPNGEPDDACRLTPGDGPCVGTGPVGEPPMPNPNNTARGFNTPSLLGVIWAAPYLHSGSAATLTDRIMTNPGDVHGNTSGLTSDQVSDLVSYLQTL